MKNEDEIVIRWRQFVELTKMRGPNSAELGALIYRARISLLKAEWQNHERLVARAKKLLLEERAIYERYDSMLRNLRADARIEITTSTPKSVEAHVAATVPLSRSEPPAFAEIIIGLIMDREPADALLGDLEEDFQADLNAGVSEKRAAWRYTVAAIRAVFPLILAAAKRVGLLGLVADYARRLLH